MTEDDGPVDIALEVLKHEMKANEKVSILFSQYPEKQSSDAMIEAFRTVMGNIHSAEKAENVIGIMEMFSRQVQNDKMMKAVLEEARDNELIELEEQEVN